MNNNVYEDVKNKFLENNCSLLTSEEDFNKLTERYPKYKYIASCGHLNVVHFHSFSSRKTGILCPSCIKKLNGKKRKEQMKEDKLQNIRLEFDCISYFISLLDETFIIKKAFDGCLADIIIKPNSEEKDNWLGIQVKTTCNSINGYGFHIEQNYKNLLILCVCWENKKMWLIPNSVLSNQIKISIGLNKSKYEKYEINQNTIKNKLEDFYSSCEKFSYEILDTPLCEYQKREKEFYKYRESKINFLKFDYNVMEGMVYDYKIGNKKVQEKVAGILKNSTNNYVFNLCKNNGKLNEKNKREQISYEKGDSDIYWLNCSDKVNFYVVPENVLIEQGKIREKNGTDKAKKTIKISTEKSNWLEPYKFNYEDIDKERLMELFL
jgi:hypothetical protein